MGMWDGLFGGKPEKLDTRDWHPQIDDALELFSLRKWNDLSLLVSRQTVNSAFSLINALGARTSLEDDVGKYPQTPAMWMTMGGLQAVWAWRHRGYSTAEEVDETRWPRYYNALEQAQLALNQLLEVRENSAVGLAFMGRVLTGLADVDKLAAVEAQFCACNNQPVEGYAVFLQARSPKWHGDHPDMFAFARKATTDRRVHPARHALLARAHIECWLFDAWMADDEAVNKQGKVYMSLPSTIEDICRLNAEFNNDMAENEAAQQDEAACRFAHNNLGLALHLAGQSKEAGRHISALKHHPAITPWSYVLGEDLDKEWWRLRKSVGLSRRIPV